MRKASCARIRLTWSLPPHSPAGRFAHKSETPHYYSSRFYRQDLHLSRTMLTTPWVAYVDRFACDWLRLATTDLSYACSFTIEFIKYTCQLYTNKKRPIGLFLFGASNQ